MVSLVERFVEFLSDGLELPAVELGGLDAAPLGAGPDHRGVHEIQHRLLAEDVGGHLRPPSVLAEVAAATPRVGRQFRPAVLGGLALEVSHLAGQAAWRSDRGRH